MKVKRTKYMYKRKRTGLKAVIAFIIVAVLFGAGWYFSDEIFDFLSPPTLVPSAVSTASIYSETLQSQPEQTGSEVSPVSEPSQPSEPQPVAFSAANLNAVTPDKATVYDTTALTAFCNSAAADGKNAVIIDVKDDTGYLVYSKVGYDYATSTANPEYASANSKCPDPLYVAVELPEIVKTIKDNGLFAIARINCFMDNVGGTAVKKSFVSFADGTIWLDNSKSLGGLRWLNPYSESARNYNLTIAKDCGAAGFDAVIADRVQFPDGVGLYKISYGADATASKQQLLTQFIQSLIDESGTSVLLTVRYFEDFQAVGENPFEYKLNGLSGYLAVLNSTEVTRTYGDRILTAADAQSIIAALPQSQTPVIPTVTAVCPEALSSFESNAILTAYSK